MRTRTCLTPPGVKMASDTADCAGCGRRIYEGDTGWYYQKAVQMSDDHHEEVLTFMDRVTECAKGGPHVPLGGDTPHAD